jgi:trans-aconitate methyltransferase
MPNSDDSINYEVVRKYFDGAADGASAAASFMAHGQDLPAATMRYRLERERRTISDWLAAVPKSSAVLDLGCGAGAWTTTFADRYAHVTAIEGSRSMVEAARRNTRNATNVEILEGDVRVDVPERKFQLAFLGGLCMYLNDDDVVALLRALKERLIPDGPIVLRESTVPGKRRTLSGEYQVVYRSVGDYHLLFAQAGFSDVDTRRNYAYTSMEIAIELVGARRKWLSFLPRQSPLLGAMTWWCLRLASPVSFWALPRVFARLGIAWPSLQNHFFRLTT